MPLDVRKAYGLPGVFRSILGLRPYAWGVAPNLTNTPRPVRGWPHIRRHSRWLDQPVNFFT